MDKIPGAVPSVGVVEDLPEILYLNDPCDEPSLNASTAINIANDSAAHGYLRHPRLGGAQIASTSAMDKGKIIHAALLGSGAEMSVIDAPDWRTKAAKEARDDARANGYIPILAKDHAPMQTAGVTLRQKLGDRGIDFTADCVNEASLFWQHQVNRDASIQCRARLDSLVTTGQLRVRDLKTCKSAHPKAIQQAISRYGYEVQAHAYRSAVEHLHPDEVGRVIFEWVFVEIEPPYAVTVCRPSEAYKGLGKAKWEQAASLFHHGQTTGEWPDYTDGHVLIIEPRPWDLQDMIEGDA